MAGVFFSSPYLKGGKQAAKLTSLTKYISTREGVELLKDTDSSLTSVLPVTVACSLTKSAARNCRRGKSRLVTVRTITRILQIIQGKYTKRLPQLKARQTLLYLHPTRPQSKLLSPPRGNCACSLHPAPVHSEPPLKGIL